MSLLEATAFAPATVGNVAVGFDILGFAIDGVRDQVVARVLPTNRDGRGLQGVASHASPQVVVSAVTGLGSDIPLDAEKNTASIAVKHLLEAAGSPFAVELVIDKGIPLSAGMGGSAASAVAAVVAVNRLLPQPFSKSALLEFALKGEAAASGAMHADNVAPCLFGGLKLILKDNSIYDLPVPKEIFCVLIHPEVRVETKRAREILKPTVSLPLHIEQSSLLAGFIHGCHIGDLNLIGKCLKDVIIEPQRSSLIPEFAAAKRAALSSGALGFSISGSGPSVFAWTQNLAAAEKVKKAVTEVFQQYQPGAWISQLSGQGAGIVGEENS